MITLFYQEFFRVGLNRYWTRCVMVICQIVLLCMNDSSVIFLSCSAKLIGMETHISISPLLTENN